MHRDDLLHGGEQRHARYRLPVQRHRVVSDEITRPVDTSRRVGAEHPLGGVLRIIDLLRGARRLRRGVRVERRSWSNPVTFDSQLQDGDDAVSCPDKGFCMVVDDNGNALPIIEGSPESSRQLDSSSVGLNDVSCASAARCVAVGGQGRVYTYSASTNARR